MTLKRTLHESDDLGSFLAPYTNAEFERTPDRGQHDVKLEQANLLALDQRTRSRRYSDSNLFGLEATSDRLGRLSSTMRTRRSNVRPRKELRPHQTGRVAMTCTAVLKDTRSWQADHGVRYRQDLHRRSALPKRIAKTRRARAVRRAVDLTGRAGPARVGGRMRKIPIRAFAVCSDPKVGRGGDSDGARVYDLPIPATTDAARLARGRPPQDAPDRLTVVFSTYQSMQRDPRRAEAAGMPAFDLAVCDEAHRTTGYDAFKGEERSNFLMIHDADAINARKRLLHDRNAAASTAAAAKRKAQAGRRISRLDGRRA